MTIIKKIKIWPKNLPKMAIFGQKITILCKVHSAKLYEFLQNIPRGFNLVFYSLKLELGNSPI